MQKNLRKYRLFILILFILEGMSSHLYAQIKDTSALTPAKPASLPNLPIETGAPTTTSPNTNGSLAAPVGFSVALDTVPPNAASTTTYNSAAIIDLSKVPISNDGLDDVIDYGARDSMWFDAKNKQLHLYGKAFMKYTSIDLKAGYILLDYNLNMVSAKGVQDSSGRLADTPTFSEGDQNFSAKEIKYNFKSKKGIIYEAYTKQEDLYVLGEKAKFVSTQTGDTSKAQNTIFNENAILTTCDDPHPHFGIRTKKLKVIPDKLVVIGPSLLEIGGVPTPLVLPFGFFPITKTKKSGLIIPRDYEFSEQWGFGLKNIGYYIPLTRSADLTLHTDIYFQGTFSFGGDLRYQKKYKHTGTMALNYNNRVSEDNKANKIRAKSYSLRLNHSQDSKAHPTRRFGGSVNIETNRDQNRNRNDYQSVYQNTLSSNLTYSQSFPGKPFQLTASMSHSQNTRSRVMNIELPNVNLTMQQIYPLKRKKQVGKERWYEKASLSYTSQLRNSLTATDTTLFTKETLNKARMGIQHRANSSLPLRILKYVTVAPNISYEENWYPYTINHELLPKNDTIFDQDSIDGQLIKVINYQKSKWGKDTIVRNWDFHSFRTFNAGISANTALFMTKQFKKGWFRGIRHKVTPSASFGFGPDFTQPKYNYFREYYTSTRPEFGDSTLRTYGIFDEAIFGRPSNSKRQLGISYGLNNVLEIKHWSRRDSTTRKVKIFDNLNFTGSYLITADSLKWTTIGTSGVFRFFKGVTNISWRATFDPYITDPVSKRRVNKFALKEQGKLLLLANLGFTFNSGFTMAQVKSLFSKKKNDNTATPANAKPDDFLSWFESFRFSHTIAFDRRLLSSGKDTLVFTNHSIGVSGRIPLTSKWDLTIGNISYDFQEKSLVYPDLMITRDLHCWQMSFSWQPARGTYNFFINVKPGTLDFLKVPYKRNNADAPFSF